MVFPLATLAATAAMPMGDMVIWPWPIMLAVQAFFDRLREEAQEAEQAAHPFDAGNDA